MAAEGTRALLAALAVAALGALAQLLLPLWGSAVPLRPTPTHAELATHERWEQAMYGLPASAMPPSLFAWHPERFSSWAEHVLAPSTGSRLAVLPELLSGAECEALMRLARSAPQLASASAHYQSRLTVSYADRNYNATHVSPEDAALVAALEEKLSHLVGLPFNPTDTRLQLTHQGPDAVEWEQQTSAPAAIHHDFNPMPTRIATVIIYLTDTEEGGETAFPWFGTGSEMFREISHEALERESNAFYIGPQGRDRPRSRRPESGAQGTELRAAAEAAVAAHDGDGDGALSPAELRRWLADEGGKEGAVAALRRQFGPRRQDPAQVLQDLASLADLDGDGGLGADELAALLQADAREVAAYLTTKRMCADQLGRGHPPGSVRHGESGGLSIKPKAGLAVVFWSRHTDGLIDSDMWHYTCPVVEGAKWVAQKFKGARLAWPFAQVV